MSRRRGFTLIELLVVLTILALLFTIGSVALNRSKGAGDEAKTKATIEVMKGLLEQYRTKTGDYPPSTLAKLGVRSSNVLFEGIEAMVLALSAKDYSGERLTEDDLMNLDDDSADKNISIHPNPVLLEVVDAWKNPFVYMRYDSYASEQEYEFVEQATSERQTVKVKALKNSLTGGPYSPQSYQLISAGPDGIFGNGDDIMSFSTHD